MLKMISLDRKNEKKKIIEITDISYMTFKWYAILDCLKSALSVKFYKNRLVIPRLVKRIF